MGILDEAIKEHLELKRQHGAADSELQQLEDEAFGPPERPGAEATADDALAEAPTEFMTAPETGEEKRQESAAADLQEAPPPAEPVEDEDREAIAEQPTEHFDVEEELAGSERRGPSDEELVEEEIAEPRLAPVDPLADMEAVEEIEVAAAPDTAEDDDEDDDFWNEQRLSEELDQALDAPLGEDRPEDIEAETAVPEQDEEAEEDEEATAASGSDADSDVLEKTPDFLEDAPEDDELWFEQKPPKDFDFDD